jgi:hypothetical protein
MPKILSNLATAGLVDADRGFRHGDPTMPSWTAGLGSPEGAVSAAVGSIHSRIDGGVATAVYQKESGTGNTGWVVIGTGAGGGVDSVDGRTGDVTLSDLYVDTTGDTMTGQLNAPSVALGTNPATTGVLRLANAQAVTARNAANTGNGQLLTLTAANIVLLGSTSSYNTNIEGQGEVVLRVAGGGTFRGLYAAGWEDSITTNFFQIGSSGGPTIFTGLNGTAASRFGFVAQGTVFTNKGYSSAPAPVGVVDVVASGTGKTNLVIKAGASQTADLQQWQNSSGSVLSRVTASGTIESSTGFRQGSVSTPSWTSGSGSPEGIVVAPVGSLYSRTDGATDATIYRKESGVGAVGWVATSGVGAVASVDGRTGAVSLSDLYVNVSGDVMTGPLTAEGAYNSYALTARQTGDARPRVIIRTQGLIELGDGLGPINDTNLYRSAVDTLKTDDAFQALSFRQGSTGPLWSSGAGSPEGVVTAPIGSFFSRTDGTVGTSLYKKDSGTGNTGWAAVGSTTLNATDWSSVPVTNPSTVLSTATSWNSIGTSPFASSWHDLFRFTTFTVPTEETYDGATWTLRALSTGLFDGRENAALLLNGTTTPAIRWTFPATIQHSELIWLRFAVGYAVPTPNLSIDVERSADGTTWTADAAGGIYNATFNNAITTNVWLRIPGNVAGYGQVRITLRITNGNNLYLHALQGYSQRAGDQGRGAYVEYPYTWNYARQVGVQANPANGALTVGTNTTAASGGLWFGTDTNLYRSAADTLSTDDSFISGARIQAALSTTAGGYRHGTSGPTWLAGTGSPEGVVTAPVGSLYSRTDGAADTAVYRKEVGVGATGWVAVADVYVNTAAPGGTPNSGDLWYDTDDVSGFVLPLSVAQGGTGGTSPTMARSNLSVPYVGNSAVTAGGPTTGTYAKGDQWLDNANVLWVCTVAGSPGTWMPPVGYELAYSQITSNVSVTATVEVGSTTVVTAPTYTFDGVTPVIVEFYSPQVNTPGVAGSYVVLGLFQDGVAYGQVAVVLAAGPAGISISAPVSTKRRFTPSAGGHTYSIRAFSVNATGGVIVAGPGGPGGGIYMPTFIRITRA